MAMASNRVHRAAFVRRMNENTGSRRTRKPSSRRRLRSNKRAATGAERRAYASGYERIYGKKRRKRTKAKKAAPKRRKVAAPHRRRRASPEQMAARKARKEAARAKKRATAAKKKAARAARRAKQNTPAARARRSRARARSRWPKQTRKVRRKGKTRRVRVAYGPFRRASLPDPRRGGKKRASYLTRTGRRRRLRKIPAWAIAGAISAKEYKTSASYAKAKERIAKRRAAAARRAERGQDPFTPNPGAGKMSKRRKKKKAGSRKGKRRTKAPRRRKSAKRVRAGKKAAATRKRRKAAKAAGSKRRRKGTKRRTKSRRKSAKRRTKKVSSRRRGSTRRRKASKRRGGRRAMRVGRRKVRRLKRGLYLVKNRRRRSRTARYEENRPRRRRHKRRHLAANRRRHGRRRSRRGGLLRNGRYLRNGFGGDLKTLLKTGSLIVVGFFAHKAITKVVVDALTNTAAGTFVGMPLVGADGSASFVATWQKPLTGLVVGVIGIGGVSMVKAAKPETRMAIGAGIMVSFLESLVKTVLVVANQPKALSYLEGYSNSTAYALRGARGRRGHRRGMRGLGAARNATSIMPQYAPVGAFRQASAGMGEYFSSGASGMGEYFAGPGVQGVGHYEKAGPLALQPSRAHMGQLPVDDGIRPDSDLDHVMDLAESAAGLGQQFQQASAGMGAFRQAAAGMGEFFTASPSDGGYAESTVPTSSQWIPNGPLWAGTMTADATTNESEIPAGILQGPGGNGVLSG